MNDQDIVLSNQDSQIENKVNGFFSSYSQSTIDSYVRDLEVFENTLNISIQNTTINDINDYIASLEKMNYKNSTFNRKLYSISKIIDIYIANGIMKSNPVKELRLIKKLDKHINRDLDLSITLDEVKRVIEISKPRTALLISFLTTSGLRISELLNIKLSDIEYYNEQATKIQVLGKGEKTRTIYIKNELLEQVKDIYNNTESEFLFHSKSGNQLIRQNTYNQIKKQFSKLGLKVNQHMLRHLYVDYQINTLGKEIKATSLYVGHSSVNITLDFYCNKKLSCEDSNIL